MEDRLARGAQLGVDREIISRVRVAIVAREIARGDFQTHPMAALENVARRPHVDAVLVGLAGRDWRGIGERLAKARAHHSLREIVRVAVGAHVDQLRHEIGVGRRGRGEQLHRDGSGDFQRLGEWLSGVYQHILAPFDLALIVDSGGNPSVVPP